MFEFPKGEETPEALYLEVGRALSAFEGIEFHLSALLACALSGNDTVTHAIWQSVRTINGRIDLLRAALSVSQAASLKAVPTNEIDAAVKAALNTFELRNNVAHGVVSHVNDEGYLFVPSIAKKSREFLTPAFCYQAADIAAIERKFSEVSRYLFETFKPIYEARMEERKTAAQAQLREQSDPSA